MIPTKELRRGNLVGCEPHNLIIPCPVQTIYDSSVMVDYNNLPLLLAMDSLYPIHITADWLIKFRFYIDADAGYNEYLCYKSEEFQIIVWIHETESPAVWVRDMAIYKHPQYLHELQNL